MNAIACSKGHENPAGGRFCYKCGEALAEVYTVAEESVVLSGTKLRDRYIINQPLAQGGFGRTYLAQDSNRFNELVVLKELTPADRGTFALQKAEELFQREAAMLHKLQHPQIPRFGEVFRDKRRLFLVQEFIDGPTYQFLLNDRLEQGQCFSEAEIIQFLRQILPVLSYLHIQGIIHRDIAPDNIIYRSSDKLPVLIDLGGVKELVLEVGTQVAGDSQNSPTATFSSGGTRLGKIGYAPDEQIRLGIVAPHSDLYALGVTIVVLMTGKQPSQLIDPHTLNWIWNRELNLSEPLRRTLNRMLATRPSERFHCADDILRSLDNNSAIPEREIANNYSTNSSNSVVANTSGQGHLFDNSIAVPEEIQGWNWGAFCLPGVWCLTNQVWIGLLAWSDITLVTFFMAWPTMAVILGVKGNEWAWKSRRWRSVAAFKAHQRAWAIAGFFAVLTAVILVFLFVALIVILGSKFLGG